MIGRKVLGIACAILIGWAQGAAASPPYAAAVIDARTGAVLHASNAGNRQHPASLTKMMTLYLVFEAIRDGRLGLDQRVPVSAHAARQQPIKVGFRAGQRVPVRELIRVSAVRSANDAAVVLAEAVGGTEARFAQMMTDRARRLGLRDTTFRNATGFTAAGHLSTASDMALLGLRLFEDFPQYYNLFGRKQVSAFGRTFSSTNRLLGSYRGADGIKTGYTRAAGFNLVASAEQGGKRVIVAVLGGRSAASRNAEVARLLDLGFARAPDRVPARQPGALVALAPAAVPEPSLRPADASGGVSIAAAALAALGPSAAHAAASPAAAGEGPRLTPLRAPTAQAPLRAPAPVPRDGGTALAVGDWGVQLGAYRAREQAIARLASVAFGPVPGLTGAGREVHAAGSLYRARLTGLSRETARAACEALRDRHCLPVRIAE